MPQARHTRASGENLNYLLSQKSDILVKSWEHGTVDKKVYFVSELDIDIRLSEVMRRIRGMKMEDFE